MYVREPSTIEGSITGGCVESDVAHRAFDLLQQGGAAELVRYGISDELAGTVGLMCGGIVHVFIHEITHSRVSRAALEADRDGVPFALATILDEPRAGAQLLVTFDEVVGSLGGPPLLDRNVAREARGLLAEARTTVRRFGTDGSTLDEDLRVHIASQAAPPRLVLVGAIDFAAAIAPIAVSIGYRVSIVDPRNAFLSSPRFGAAERVEAWPHEVIPELDLGTRDAVVVFSHNPQFDVPALIAAVASEAGYIGALGSRRTTADRAERLRDAGASDADIARIHSPCGLDIGAATPEQTAIAILAEIVASRSARAGLPLRETGGPIRHTADDS
jgi:xanthine dehydrogenase accessory factor